MNDQDSGDANWTHIIYSDDGFLQDAHIGFFLSLLFALLNEIREAYVASEQRDPCLWFYRLCG